MRRAARAPHDPARDAARYLAHEGSQRWRSLFDAHLVSCEACWREVEMGRGGRAIAERARELAPPHLRDQIRAAVEMSEPTPRWRPRIVSVLAAACVVALLAAGGLSALRIARGGGTQPEPIATALAAYRSQQLNISGLPSHLAPDLSSLGLDFQAGGLTKLGRIPSDLFTYRTGEDAVFLFLATDRLPAPMGARPRADSLRGWEAKADGISLVCAERPVAYLLLSRNLSLLQQVESVLRTQPIVVS